MVVALFTVNNEMIHIVCFETKCFNKSKSSFAYSTSQILILLYDVQATS